MMKFNTFNNVRKGITPVVAIVMLLMLTILVAGGAFAFINTFMEDQEGDLQEQVATDITVQDVHCDGSTLEWTVSNTGDTIVDRSQVDILIRNVATDRLTDDSPLAYEEAGAEMDITGSERHWQSEETGLTDEFEPGTSYRITFDFVSNQVGTATGTCTG